MKKLTFTLLALFMSLSSWADVVDTWTSGDCTCTLTDDGTFTVSGIGEIEDFTEAEDRPWHGYASGITSVVIGDGVTRIGDNAFYGFTSLTSINIPKSVTSIGFFTFSNCPDALFTKDGYVKYIDDCLIEVSDQTQTSYPIKDGTRLIAEWAFQCCESLTSVTIPNSVESIGMCAFYGCSSLTTFTIPNSVTSIGDYAFEDCSLTSVIFLTTTPPTLGDYVFAKTEGSDDIDIDVPIYVPVESVSAYTDPNEQSNGWVEKYQGNIRGFNGTCGDRVVWILSGDSPNYTLTISGTGAMTDYDPYYYDPNNVEDDRSAPWYNDYSSEITTVIIENGVTSIGVDAFCDCAAITSVSIPNSVTNIKDEAFIGCEGLKSIVIPNTVTNIGTYALALLGFTSVDIPNSVESIGDYAFYGCQYLTSINISEYVTSIGAAAFSACSALETITVDSKNEYYNSSSDCNAIIETSTNTLVAGCNNTTIPNTVKTIGEGAFRECIVFTSIDLPDDLTSIEDDAFQDCSNLASIAIPENVTSIGQYAFYGCDNLATVTFHSNPDIAANAFDTPNPTFNLVLEDGQAIALNANTYKNVTLNRNLTSDYGTICLPWTPSTDYYTYYEFTSQDGTGFHFSSVESPSANTPYLYKKKTSPTNITASNVTISTSGAGTAPQGDWTLHGTYANETKTAGDNVYALYSDNKIYKNTGTLNIKPFRAYLTCSSSAKEMFDVFFDDETTGIVLTTDGDVVKKDSEIYSLNGQKVKEMVKGNVYIVNGNKYLYK